MNRNITSDLLCTKCKHILVDACKISCGCSYCRNCINDLLTDDIQFCLGNTEFCMDKSLLDIDKDYFKNKKMMKFEVKGSEELCELMNNEEHLGLCIKSPFHGLGCDVEKLRTDKMSDDLRSEGYNHNNILIEIIENLKEMDKTNKIEIQSSKQQIQILQANSLMKDETIVEIQQEIRSMKKQNQQMTQQTEALKEQLVTQTKPIIVEKTAKCHDDEIESIKMENRELARKMEILERNVEKKIQEKCAQERQECRDNLERELKIIKKGMQKSQLTKSINLTEKWQDKQVEGSFSWRVDQISDKRQKDTNNFSDIFYPKHNPYKMQLQLVNCAGSDRLFIYLYIHPGENDARLKWPYQGNILIKIANKIHPGSFKSIRLYCNIQKTSYHSYKCSNPFRFSYKELSSSGLMQDNYFIIECDVE